MKPFVEAVDPEEVNTDMLWDKFDNLFPEAKNWETRWWLGNGLPALPTVELFDPGEEGHIKYALLCTKAQAKRLKKYRKNDLIVFEQYENGEIDWVRKKELDYILVI